MNTRQRLLQLDNRYCDGEQYEASLKVNEKLLILRPSDHNLWSERACIYECMSLWPERGFSYESSALVMKFFDCMNRALLLCRVVDRSNYQRQITEYLMTVLPFSME